jgi:hypothetical protein
VVRLAGGADNARAARASWTATAPTPPAAPLTTSVCPSLTPPSTVNTRTLVSAATGSPAAASQDRLAGLRAKSSRIARSAAAPPTGKPKTSSPTATRVTSSPSSSTIPAASRPSIPGKLTGMTSRITPLRAFQSIGFTPAALTATRICPASGCGSSTSATCKTSGPPYCVYVTAFTHESLVFAFAWRAVRGRRRRPQARRSRDGTLLGHGLGRASSRRGSARTAWISSQPAGGRQSSDARPTPALAEPNRKTMSRSPLRARTADHYRPARAIAIAPTAERCSSTIGPLRRCFMTAYMATR